MQEIQQIGDGWSQSFYLAGIDYMNGRDHMLFDIAAQTGIKKLPECFLVGRIFIDIGNA